jgi:hypothetical protein
MPRQGWPTQRHAALFVELGLAGNNEKEAN